MVSKKFFIEAIKHIQECEKQLDSIGQVFNSCIYDSPLASAVTRIENDLIIVICNGNEEMNDDIYWWLYEDVKKTITLANGKEIDVEDIESFYKYLKETY